MRQMSIFIKNIFENDSPVSFQKVLASLFAIVMFRTFLEFFSNSDASGLIFGWETIYLHFPLFYFSIFLSFTLILIIFTRKSISRIWNFLLPTFFIVLLPPIIDLIATNGHGLLISYIATEPHNIFSLFFKLATFSKENGITLGIQFAGLLILSALGLFVLKNTNNFFKAISASLIGYVILFFCAITPSIVSFFYSLHGSNDSAKNLYIAALNHGLIQTTRESMPLLITTTQQQNFFHALFMSQLFWILIVLQLFFIFILPNLKYRKILIENFPLTRIIYWSGIALIGIYISQKTSKNIDVFNITTIISFCTIFLLGVLNTFFAVCVNDSEDISIDVISNPNRPLAKREVTILEWNKFSYILLFLIALGLATMNNTVTFFFILTQMSYYIYSARPLRLKRHFISSSIIIGISSASVALAGFFFVSPDQHFIAFPIKALFIIAASFALLSNMKDIKDYKGDKNEKMKTMPVVFGLRNSKMIIASLYALVFILVPILIDAHSMLFFSIICSLFAFYLFIKKQYQEKYIFLTLFFYAAMLFVTVI